MVVVNEPVDGRSHLSPRHSEINATTQRARWQARESVWGSGRAWAIWTRGSVGAVHAQSIPTQRRTGNEQTGLARRDAFEIWAYFIFLH